MATQKFNIVVTGAAYSSQSAYTALRFCQAAIAAGKQVSQVFFYQDGVSQLNDFANPLSDEFNATQQWLDFAQQHKVPLIACVASAERRGVINDELAKETATSGSNLSEAVVVAGLGVLHEAALAADRMVTIR